MKPVIIIAIAVVFGIGLALSVSAEEGLIPTWIKSTASFWVEGDISDSEFITALQFLVKEGILVIPSEQNEKTDVFQLSVKELKDQAVLWDYKDILRDEDYYIGKIIYVTGSIRNIEENDDYEGWVLLSVYTAKTVYGNWLDDLMYIWYDGSRLLYEDTIEAYIVVDGVWRVESMLGASYIYYPIGTARHLTCTNC
ncbi:hypothetical protein HX860_06805 [Marine Group I thaumarchaeote]|uniref:Uncharacterized protein n=1 Tax=Marine Group I thaumarchaeote TaxID=2511932 RepID=A0A7K4MV25_9ARCH|nr:MAG: hypothetical protein DSN69_01760 [Nitrosopumilus sp. YT1]NMI82532.1 hypothetical protein [Candidatus Nitrosopumilus sp. MTA1]NWJ20755.1 hypothetical protein [Marine Group I thaumarchaeote]NWJ29060.1 hypothetical protein [Marine Group I thaumarchaeote]NWJ57327.1 hypothetical protein [Marine Group I thaumarchaeote]